MSSETYWRAIALLTENGLEPLLIKRPSAELIAELGQRLKVELPQSYRHMLFDFGLLQVESIEIAGVGNAGLDGQSSSNVVFCTEKDRADGLISDSMVRFAVSGYGPFFVFDCAELDPQGNAPVYEVPGNGISNGKDRLFNDFGDFLLNQVDDLLEGLQEDGVMKDPLTSGAVIDDKVAYWKARAADFSS